MSAENIPAPTDAVWGGRVSGGGGGRREQGPQVTQESCGCTAHVPDSQATLLLLQRGHTFPTSQKHTVSKGCEDIACVVKPFNYLLLPSSHSQYPPPLSPLKGPLCWVRSPDPLRQTRSLTVSATAVTSLPKTGAGALQSRLGQCGLSLPSSEDAPPQPKQDVRAEKISWCCGNKEAAFIWVWGGGQGQKKRLPQPGTKSRRWSHPERDARLTIYGGNQQEGLRVCPESQPRDKRLSLGRDGLGVTNRKSTTREFTWPEGVGFGHPLFSDRR